MQTKLSVHRGDKGFFVAYGYVKAGDVPVERCRVSPYYSTAEAAIKAYNEKRDEYDNEGALLR